MDYELRDRAAIVTGGGAGIGAAVARTLAASGGAGLGPGPHPPAARAGAESIAADGGRAEPFEADVTDPAAVDAMVEACLDAFGGLRIAVNNAGIHGDPSNPPVADYPPEWWDRIVATNLSSVFPCLRAEI